MQVITQIYSLREYELFKNAGVIEFIIGLKDYSVSGEMDLGELIAVVQSIRKKDPSSHLFLDFDLLITESNFDLSASMLSKIPLQFFDAVRVRDLGFANYIATVLKHPFHFICEAGVRNLNAAKALQGAFGPLLQRMVLPYELTAKNLQEWASEFGCKMEILGIGPLRLFYSKRKLLSPLIPGPLPCHAKCSTSFIRNRELFDVIEKSFGTLIYFSKDLSLLPYWQEISQMGIGCFRIDRYFNRGTELLDVLMDYLQTFNSETLKAIREKWVRPWIHGFYKANQTGRNYESEQERRRTETYEIPAGEILEASKGNYLVACFEMSMCLPLNVILKTPLNQKVSLSLVSVKDFKGNLQSRIVKGIPYLLPPVQGITAKTRIILEND